MKFLSFHGYYMYTIILLYIIIISHIFLCNFKLLTSKGNCIFLSPCYEMKNENRKIRKISIKQFIFYIFSPRTCKYKKIIIVRSIVLFCIRKIIKYPCDGRQILKDDKLYWSFWMLWIPGISMLGFYYDVL